MSVLTLPTGLGDYGWDVHKNELPQIQKTECRSPSKRGLSAIVYV